MPFVQLDTLSSRTYDYIIVGGGTAGLTAATRLSEDPSIDILVLDAGKPNLDDAKILTATLYGATFGDPNYDWAFRTTKQDGLNGGEVPWSRGKSLGGSSAMNFASWVKPPAADIDALEKLGNPGWNWENYLEFSKKVERFHTPAPEVLGLYPHTFNESQGGTHGPIHVSIPHHVHTLDEVLHPTFLNSGLKANPNPYDGDINGALISASAINPATGKRSYAANSYLMPNIGRTNLSVTTEAVVSRLIFASSNSGQGLTATGVEIIQGGQTFIANAKREVIVSAGAINSPKILELSGIGNPSVLQKLGVMTKLDLPGVGENVQEHCCFPVAMELDPGVEHETLDLLRDPAYAEKALKLQAENKGILRHGVTSFAYFPLSAVRPDDAAAAAVQKLEADFKKLDEAQAFTPSARELFLAQLEAVKDTNCAWAAAKPEDGKRYLTLVAFLNRPFSKGTIHAVSNDPFQQPDINPKYFDIDYDLEQLVQLVKYIRQLAQTEPLKSSIAQESFPGSEIVSDEDIRSSIKKGLSSTWHTIGSCSMLPREKDGVVDPELKVYGTTNVRVADLSIVPLHVVAHTQVTAYVIGEKVADMIKAARA